MHLTITSTIYKEICMNSRKDTQKREQNIKNEPPEEKKKDIPIAHEHCCKATCD
jgi:hypothetical protein